MQYLFCMYNISMLIVCPLPNRKDIRQEVDLRKFLWFNDDADDDN